MIASGSREKNFLWFIIGTYTYMYMNLLINKIRNQFLHHSQISDDEIQYHIRQVRSKLGKVTTKSKGKNSSMILGECQA